MASKVNDGRPAYICRPKVEQPGKAPTAPKRKKGLKRETEKRAMLRALVNPGRKGFLELHPVCMRCGRNLSDDVHEIARGHAREGCLLHPELQLALCRFPCHEDCGDYAKCPLEYQVAVRLVYDLERNLETLNTLRGRAPDAIDLEMVLAQVREVIRKRNGG